MTRGKRIVAIAGLSILGLLVLATITGVVIVRTEWFRNYVREKIIAVTEESTGGKVEIGAFAFDWTHLRATINNFVLHGTEKPTEAPLFQARNLAVELKLLASLKNYLDIHSLAVDTPQANIIVNPDGSTNVPAPKIKKQSDKSGLETVVDLAIKRFDLNNGSFTFAMQKLPLDAHGQNLRAQLLYNTLGSTYEGRLALDPLLVGYQKNPPVQIHADLPVTIAKDKITLKDAKISTPESELLLTGTVENMNDPKTSVHATGHLSVQEAARIAGVKVGPQPGVVQLDAALTLDKDRINIQGAHATLGTSQIEASGILKDPSGNGNVQLNASLALAEIGKLLQLPERPEGTAQVAANLKLTGTSSYQATGNISAKNVAFTESGQRYRNIALNTAFSANPAEIALNGLKLDAFGGQFAGNADVKDLKTFSLTGKVNHLDIGTLLQTFTGKPAGYSGTISGPVTARGDLKNPKAVEANVQLAIAPGTRGLPLSGKLNASYNGRTGAITVAPSSVSLPHSKLDLSGSIGRQLQVKLETRDLNDFLPAMGGGEPLPIKLAGPATFQGTVTGDTANPKILGHLVTTAFSIEGRSFDRLAADIAASSSGVALSNGQLTRGPMETDLAANVALKQWKLEPNLPLTVDAKMRNGDIADLVALSAQPNPGVSGPINATIQIAGTESQLTAKVQADSTFAYAQTNAPKISGTANTNLDVRASLVNAKGVTDFQLLAVNGNVKANGLQADGQSYGNLNADLRTANNTVHYDVTSDMAGSNIRASGDTKLTKEYPTTATASIANLPIERVLALAGRKDIAARGVLSATASFNGTVDAPAGNADFTLSNAVLEDEPLDRVHARVNMTPQSIDVSDAEVRAGPSRLTVTASYKHPLGDLYNGEIHFQTGNSTLQLDKLRIVQKYKPGLAGAVRMTADGAAAIKKTKDGEEILLSRLNANVNATALAVNRLNLGDLKLIATTQGDRVTYTLDSDIAKSTIHGQGETTLRADYPTTAQLTFANLTYSGLRPLLSTTNVTTADFDAVAAGSMNVNGPLLKIENLKGRLEVSKLEITAKGRAAGLSKPVAIRNQGPIVASLDRSLLRIDSARLTGPQTDIQLKGSAPINGTGQLDLTVSADTNLSLLQEMSRSVYSSGAIVLRATVKGTASDPLINGRLDLKDASLNLIDLPNGLSHANGAIIFNGTNATIQSLTAESGGGKITANGFAGYSGGNLSYNLKATAADVRVRYPEGATIQTSATLALSGTSARSVLSGNVTLNQIGFSPKRDFGSMLSRTNDPVKAPTADEGPLANLQLDIRIRTAANVSLLTPLAQGLQAEADLRLRGSVDSPGMTGRINITEGDLVFFGTKYKVNQGTIAFYNPFAIQPILNIDLETVAKGVDVVLTVSGPIDNMKLTYRSDPPLQFNELVSLLATGKTPTSDPTLVANEPATPPQSFQQMGESAIVSQAVANPIAGRLQRVFGVNQLKIDPSFTSGSDLPQARLTLQQQITNNVTFSYITNLAQANSQIIRVEWALNEEWSATATREENGRFGVDFFFKKKFR